MTTDTKQTDNFPGASRTSKIPSAIRENDLLSPTAVAGECFVNQRFSNKLQAYLIGYVNSVFTDYSVYSP